MSELSDAELEELFASKPEATESNPVFENTFSYSRNKWLRASTIFLGLKRGAFQWKKLPKEVQAGVRTYLDSKEFKKTLV